ncbi:MAG: RNA methyltransferase [Gammaproteobacteria bacterium]|nr:RNA methyltransferase [Gammaproteobacteria bacterium]
MVQDRIRFCLVRTTHPGNIGATARAMKTMGLRRLYLVNPARFPDDQVRSRAAGAGDVLDEAVVSGTLVEALAGCELVLGTTARERKIGWPTLSPEFAARQLVEEARLGRRTAVVFGTERSGLSNEDVELCHQLIRIPTGDDYASLNLGAAAQIIAYEILKYAAASAPAAAGVPARPGADPGEMRQFYRHLQETLEDLDFIKVRHPPVVLMRKLVRLFNRARPEREELNILRGILTAIQDNLKPSRRSRK